MSTLHVENLKGLSSGGNANKIIVPSGQTIDASAGTLCQVQANWLKFIYSTNTATTSYNKLYFRVLLLALLHQNIIIQKVYFSSCFWMVHAKVAIQ